MNIAAISFKFYHSFVYMRNFDAVNYYYIATYTPRVNEIMPNN